MNVKSECHDCRESFDAGLELIRYSEGHVQVWICMDCHDKREWKWKT